jgi:tetratricopeptide (TPR) repeat protein
MNSRSFFLVAILCLARIAAAGDSWDESRRIGTAAREQGRYLDAKPYLEIALAQFPFDPQDMRRADLDDELAGVYEVLGDEAAAERLYREAFSIVRQHPDDSPAIQISAMSDFGAFLSNQGRFLEAAEILEAGLRKARQVFGERDVRTATMKSGLGQMYLLEGKLPESKLLLREAVDVHQASLTPRDLDRIVSESSLGYLYVLERRYEKAEPILQQVSEDARKLGEMHPTFAFTLSNLADLYRVEGKTARVDPLLRRVLAIYENTMGPGSLKVAETLLDISIDLITSRKYTLAEENLDRALQILRKTSGQYNTAFAIGEYRLACTYLNEGKYPEAESLLRHGLSVVEKTWPEGHSVFAAFLYEMAEVERFNRHYADAELAYKRAIAMYEKFEPSGSPGMALALKQYARLLKTTRHDEARALQKRAREMEKTVQAFQ